MLDVGRHIADELVQTTAALNDVLARATRLVTLSNAAMLARLGEEKGLAVPTAMEARRVKIVRVGLTRGPRGPRQSAD